VTVNSELKRNTKQAAVGYLNVLSTNFPVGTNKTTKALIIVCPDRDTIQIATELEVRQLELSYLVIQRA